MAHFRTSARTVDMLGRQQIAGVPTAISELFKNAHDAYATQAVADFVRYEDLLVLRDDGVGMTREQFERNWLTLGTAAKARADMHVRPPDGMSPRAVLGEKGIGRLAIAAIGPQVLVLTRSSRNGRVGRLTTALIHWGLFELPDVQLDQIKIPVVETLGRLPDVVGMSREIVTMLRGLVEKRDAPIRKRIIADLRRWERLDLDELAETIGERRLVGRSGTTFVIVPTSPDLAADLREPEDKEAPPLLKTLIGFANTMTPGHSEPELHTSFIDHRAPDLTSDLIAESAFFTPPEFEAADHHFKGRFDEFGQFDGTVAIFGGEPIAFPLAWNGARGERTQCGPFELNLAYVQGRLRYSRLDPDAYHLMSAKLDRYGGLYIYRDGIRILPYGDSRVDWLDVELRRNKSASDHFFSYRRMFGAAEITRAENAGLREKAGREGFATNEAYRQFRGILMQFLKQVAMEFFREGAQRSEDWIEGRRANERLDKARRVRSRHVRVRRGELRSSLGRFFADIDEGVPAAAVEDILATLRTGVREAGEARSAGDGARLLAAAELAARDALQELAEQFEVRRPRGVGLTKELARDYEAYERERVVLREELIDPCAGEIEAIVSAASNRRQAAIQRRVRFDESMRTVADHSRETLQTSRRELNAAARHTRTRSNELARSSYDSVDQAVQEVLAQAARLDVAEMSDQQFVAQRSALEARVRDTAAQCAGAMANVAEQLRTVAWPVNGAGPLVTAADQVEELESRLEAFIDRSEQDLELTQLGLAVEIINHEFQVSIRAIRENLRRLRGWAEVNRELRPVYRDMRGAFDHLDGYLKLFTPLHRRLYRSEVDIVGRDVEQFVRDVFRERLTQEDIELKASTAFRAHVVRMYPSTLYPVFVNVVDNAVHWLSGYRGRREVLLDVDDGDLTITDSGPGVGERDRIAVFEMGFSRKPGGTGYGLYISREVLRREGMDLVLDPSDADHGARFRIIRVGEGGG